MSTTSVFRNVQLKDIVLAVFSLAAMRGTTKIKLAEFFDAFHGTSEQFPEIPVRFVRLGGSFYSKRLEDALNSWLGNTIEHRSYNGRRYLTLSRSSAARHISWLREEYREDPDWLDVLEPVAEYFIEHLNVHQGVRTS